MGLTPYEFICKQWTIEPEGLTLNPIHRMPGLNSQSGATVNGLRRYGRKTLKHRSHFGFGRTVQRAIVQIGA